MCTFIIVAYSVSTSVVKVRICLVLGDCKTGDAHDLRGGDSARDGHGVLDLQLQGAHQPHGIQVCGLIRVVGPVCAHRDHGRLLLLLRHQVTFC